MSNKFLKTIRLISLALLPAVVLLLAGCGGTSTTRAKAGETVHTALFDFTCSQAEVVDSYEGIDIPEGEKLVQFTLTVQNTSEETYQIFKDDFQLQWGDGDDDFGVGLDAVNDRMMPDAAELVPGAEQSGQMLAAVPQEADTLTVAYQEILENGENGNNFFVDLSL